MADWVGTAGAAGWACGLAATGFCEPAATRLGELEALDAGVAGVASATTGLSLSLPVLLATTRPVTRAVAPMRARPIVVSFHGLVQLLFSTVSALHRLRALDFGPDLDGRMFRPEKSRKCAGGPVALVHAGFRRNHSRGCPARA